MPCPEADDKRRRQPGDGRADPVAAQLLSLWPAATGPLPNDFFGAPAVPEDQWSYDLRIDHNFGDKDNVYGVYDRYDVVRVIERGAFE
ncbi:MAG: hypothetical protein IH991_13185, partial [Planctomycetes bacterium]|nr:hypothetical protein [Planctomycetota bacterium]